MKFVPVAVTRKLAVAAFKTKKNSPSLLFGAGVVSVVASTVLACKATLKVEEVLEKHQNNLTAVKTMNHADYSEDDRMKDKALIYTQAAVDLCKLYGPALVVGMAGVAALTKSHSILKSRNAALLSAYTALDKAFNEYRKRVREEVGEENEMRLMHGAVEREIVEEGKNGPEVKSITTVGDHTPSPYARFFDEFSPSWSPRPEINLLTLRNQQIWANEKLRANGHMFLNEVYDMLGIPRSKAGAVVGWMIGTDGDNMIDFGIFNGDNSKARDFVNGREGSILLDFNVDGVIYDKI